MCDSVITNGVMRYLACWSFTLLALATLSLQGCSANSCGTFEPGHEFLSIWYSAGGPAPLLASVVISENGMIKLTSSRDKSVCATLTASEFGRLRESIDTEGLAAAVAAGAKDGADYYDYEEVELRSSEWEGSIPVELLAGEVEVFLDQIDDLVQEHFDRPAPWKETSSLAVD